MPIDTKVYILVKVDFRDKKNIGVFDTQAKAKAFQVGYELDAFENGDLCGISFYIEEWNVK